MHIKQLLLKLSYKLAIVLGSRQCFYGIILLFVLQALWFAFSAQYPMAFDENFHYGLIQVYSEQWSPFIATAPEGTGPLGALTREPSYLFAYLMSFPYRIFTLLTESQDALIILLRVINVALFTTGLFAFRKLLLSVRASSGLTHFAIAMITLIPITPFLAAHINYDNLLFLLVPYVLIITVSCARELQRNSFPVLQLLLLISLCCITSVVKYPFLPIAAAAAIYLLGVMFWKKNKKDLSVLLHSIAQNFRKTPLLLKVGILTLTFASSALFIERHVVNYVQYGSFVPDCAEVISFEHCSQYGPWARNYEIYQNSPEYVEPNLVFYAANWYYDMTYRLFFAINSAYYTQPPLYLPFITAHFIATSGVFLCIFFARRLIRKYPGLLLFAVIIVIYTATLFSRGYSTYLSTTEFLALNGRYFIPILPLMLIFIGLAYRELFNLIGKNAIIWKTSFAIIGLFLMLQGGGVLTYILRSDADWHRQDAIIVNANEMVKHWVRPLILKHSEEVPLSN